MVGSRQGGTGGVLYALEHLARLHDTIPGDVGTGLGAALGQIGAEDHPEVCDLVTTGGT